MFKKLGIEQKILHYRTDDVMLAYLYQHACALVNPSLYEGFGLPLLEAFSCGCPVAASQASCFPEIAGEAALYFNPLSEDSIREVVARVIYDDDLKEKLIYKGYKRLAMFSWSKTAEETLKAYNRCLELHETIKR
ncbi:MAG: hypothetical protein KatS3mg031_0901 [Chitinophagales bacterium]|nr:MAG: hypothetical protein KatS3mg031_0901 [Chitinophagales bacterium]